MNFKVLVQIIASLVIVHGHSWMTCPPSFQNKIIQRGGIQGSWCEPESSTSPVTHVVAGDRLKVGWTSNNHAGGWVRISLVPHGQHLNEAVLKANVMKIVCYGHDTRPRKTKNGDCIHPCNGRPGCQYQSNAYDIHRFDTTIGIPTNLQPGDYVLQLTMMVGNSGSPYNSCGKLRITGGNTQFNCKSTEPILVYSCLKSGGPFPKDSLLPGAKRGDFCYGLDGSIGSIDDNLLQVPINVECDPRLSCANSVGGEKCRAEEKMTKIVDGSGPFPRLPGCFVYNTLPDLEPSCVDGRQNGDETGVDCGGLRCPACPTDPTKTFSGDYYSSIEQTSQLWWGSGHVTITINIIKDIQPTQCWQLLLQFKHSMMMSADAWGQGMLVKRAEQNRILTFEKSGTQGWNAGNKISITFPINKGDIPDEIWQDEEEMQFITALFEVYNNPSECSGVKIKPN